jgi:hypothetical protein
MSLYERSQANLIELLVWGIPSAAARTVRSAACKARTGAVFRASRENPARRSRPSSFLLATQKKVNRRQAETVLLISTTQDMRYFRRLYQIGKCPCAQRKRRRNNATQRRKCQSSRCG